MVFGAHPDDSEIGMGGTIKKYAESNYKIVMIDLTKGEMSSNGNIEQREIEAQNAQLILDVSSRINLDFEDRNIVKNIKNIEKVSDVIRKYKPTTVFYPSEVDSHPDHRAASILIEESIFHAKLSKFVSSFEAYQVPKQFKYAINESSSSDFYVDISDQFVDKMRALQCYESQFIIHEEGKSTRLNKGFIDYIEATNRQSGYRCGVKFAEGFQNAKVNVIRDISQWEALFDE